MKNNKKILTLSIALCSLFTINKVQAQPVNTAFKDDIFYACVIKNYNQQKNTDYDITHNLTDEELESMTYLECYDGTEEDQTKWISNTSGLEKMTGLTSLSLDYNNIEEIDVSKNTQLQILHIYESKLGDIDLSKNTNLTKIVLGQPRGNIGYPTFVHIKKNNNISNFIEALGKEQLTVQNDNLVHVTDLYTVETTTIRDQNENEIALSNVQQYVQSHDVDYLEVTYKDNYGNDKIKYHSYIIKIDDGINQNNDTNTNTDNTAGYAYSIDDYTITFVDAANRTHTFNITSFMDAYNYEKEHPTSQENVEDYEKTLQKMKEFFKEDGNFIDMYTLTLMTGVPMEPVDGFTFSIKMSDEMKKYDTLKLITVDNYNSTNPTKGYSVELKKDGDYLIGKLPNLGFIALVGTNNKVSNPKTGIPSYGTIGLITIIALGGTYIVYKKKMSN